MLKVNGNILNLKPYEPGKTIEEIKKEYKLDNIIKLASNENAFGTSPKAIQALKNFSEKAYLYADGSCSELKSKISEKYEISDENIVTGNGSNEIIELIYRTFTDKGDKIISCLPTFSFYKIAAETTFGEYINIPLKNYKFDLDAIEERIDNKTKIIIICNPNNPTGTIVEKDKLERFLKNVSNNVLVVLDEAYIDFACKDKVFNTIEFLKENNEKNIIVLRTFSKIYGLAALRIGYGISNKWIISCLNRVRQPFNVNGFAQVAAIAALDDNDFLNKTLKGIEKGKKYIYREFENLGVEYLESSTNFIFFKLNYDNDLIFKKFLEKGVIIRSLKSFGYNNALRVTVGTEFENRRFIDTLKSILNSVTSNF